MAEVNDEMAVFLRTSIAQHKEAFCVYMEQHAHMEVWGYPKLDRCFKRMAKWKTRHIEILQERLEYFDIGSEDVEYDKIEWPRHDMQGMIEVDLRMEQVLDLLARRAKARGLVIDPPDPVTANMFTKVARTAEKAIMRLQAILSVIDETSIKMYRQNVNLE